MGEKQEDEPARVANGETLLPLDTVFTILSNRRRRTILSHVMTCKYPVPFEELVDIVATREADGNAVEPADEIYKQVAIDLYHTQLPKLADWDVIDYNQNLHLIRPAETLRPLDEYLHLAEQHDRYQQIGDTEP